MKLTSWIDLVTGGLLAGHGIATVRRTPLRARAQQMQRRGFKPGVPHALGIPGLEVLSGLGLASAAVRRASGSDLVGTGSAVAATALGGTRLVIDREDGSVTSTTGGAAALTLAGVLRLLTSTRGRPVARILTLGSAAAAITFEAARRRRVLCSR
ncbi:hypothetical protein [Curtobacterium flaccumfaciens]|uniref:hypothetical protein n=1 Tax=Curtobacterium flaccumfaciens TaxID=2035 RepID=UPI000FFE95C7|nr:hypothetical protein [Curtobacterium flaccumfaciens]MCS0647081.1 hypothetical protein [Curtobacterium flaccumfaciens pv. flaccumfaciens]MCS6524676.1 hypothetical protein [Curtobacterium flaccumfaciens pv. flaccumfaciens]MCS6529822.1 hypothetical protein [Curtobacterium flaccumfaciens pv. flaccumfaciens]NUU11272.1 hypothetical protein [Curtobacterium flaccumfaciens]